MKLLVALLVVACFGSTQAAKYCCYPPVWESLNFFRQGALVNGSVVSTVGEEQVSVDTVALMVNSMASITSASVTTAVRTLQDFKAGKQYQIIGDNCKQSTIGPYTNKCVPDDARLDLQANFGIGNDTLPFDVFTMLRGNVTIQLNIAQPDCVPVAVNGFGSTSQGSGLSSKLYTNFTTGIKDRSVFNVPSICQHAPHVPIHKMHPAAVHEFF